MEGSNGLSIAPGRFLRSVSQAFDAIWNVLREDDPFRDYAGELRTVIGQKLTTLVGDGVTDATQLRN